VVDKRIASDINFEPILDHVKDNQPSQDFGLALGTVISLRDVSNGGRILVRCKTFFGDSAKEIEYSAPGAGAGYGFFSPPGKGATVVIAKLPLSEPAVRYVCLGGVYTPFAHTQSVRTQPYGTANDDLIKEEVSDDSNDAPIINDGIPDAFESYAGNNQPDIWSIKHPCGHGMILGRKVTSDINQNEIRLKTAGDKKIIMSDAPYNSGGDKIQLIDENKNSIAIHTDDDSDPNSLQININENILVDTKTGSIEHTISSKSKGDYAVENHGFGDINHTAAKGNISQEAAKTITLTAGGKAKIIMSANAIILTTGGTTMTITDSGVDIV